METSFLAHRSGNIYGPAVLEDNWYEDRDQDVTGEPTGKMINRNISRSMARRNFETHFITAPRCFRRVDMTSLRRCLGDTAGPEHDTTSRVDFEAPVRPVTKKLHKMVRLDTFKHAKNPRPTERPQEEITMWSSHPRHPDSFGRRELETTTQSEYESGLTEKEDPLRVGGTLACRGGHEKAKTNFNVFPFGHAKNNFNSTPGVRDSFGRENLMTEGNGVGASKPLGDGEPKRFARVYSFTGMARRGGARVFYDEKPPLAMNSC